MKKIALLALAFLMSSTVANAANTQQMTREARGAIKLLGAELKSTLKAAIKSDGPVKAISVCNEQAPKLAQMVSQQKELKVGRTSLRVRNSLNAPDAWELAVLEQFEQRKAKGEDVKKIDYSEVTQQNGRQLFRYMKAIPTGDVCLVCHGDNIADNVSAAIKKRYPNDRATGFNKGEIRGAFTVVKVLN